jgi:hypothetical protein
MTATTTNYPTARLESFFARAERWLDDRGKFAWIGAIILGFIAVWPVGLALLAYVVFFKKSNKRGTAAFARATRSMRASSGNTAFDAYRADTLRRLEEEQDNFEAFLGRLREAKDKAEFDQFMDDRARKADDNGDRPSDAA